jgi:hypothetical protein
MATEHGRSPTGPGSRPTGRASKAVSPVPASIPNAAQCTNCEVLQEEIADYMGHRTDGLAGKLWAAQHLFSRFEDQLEDLIGEFEKLGHDDYDQSLEIWGAAEDVRLGLEAQRLIADAGFFKVYLNHGKPGEEGRWETHYTLREPLPVRGWRRRYVSDPNVSTTRVIAGPVDNGYYEISYWPEGWDGERSKADLESGYFRIVPDPLAASGMETGTAETVNE